MRISERYALQNIIGRGGMGTVYRALDRLTGEAVALKRVKVTGDSTDLALAREFSMLASLHHPNIISVLDYGFDADNKPFFTMRLLDNPQMITTAAIGKTIAEKVQLILQLLQALVYLQRRRIVHYDLKPSNVLVVDGQVKVLDFGLSRYINQDEVDRTMGTLAYMAPEIWENSSSTPQSDQYSVGMIAYEMFLERYPVEQDSIDQFVAFVLSGDLKVEGLEPQINPVVQRMLTINPQDRYPNYSAAMTALCAAGGIPQPEDTSAIQESFLNAAEFVGRESVQQQMEGALELTLSGTGGLCLIGGESGVGKSRLLDEIQTVGMVKGALVLRGQALQSSFVPYQLWRDVVQRLALLLELSDLELGILQEIVPNLGDMLERDVPAVGQLESVAHQQRLVSLIAGLFRRVKRPILLLLEDLQWASGSLKPLEILAQRVEQEAILILGTYRDDETPTLPEGFPTAQVVKLNRLSEDDTAKLATSILGETKPAVLDVLYQETEGNVFFLVEVLRTITRDRLLDQQDIPTAIYPEGIRQLVARRLSYLSEPARQLLNVAAIAGRQIDLRVIHHLSAGITVDAWLGEAVNAALIEFREGQWRFTHDKIRDGAIKEIPQPQRIALHQLVAAAIEAIYAECIAIYSADLAAHYRWAKNRAKEQYFAQRAAQQAYATNALEDARQLANRALELLANDAERFEMHFVLSRIYNVFTERDQQAAHVQQMQQLQARLTAPIYHIKTAQAWATLEEGRGNYGASIQWAEKVVTISQQAGDPYFEGYGNLKWGEALMRQAEFATAKEKLTHAHEIGEKINDPNLAAGGLRILGVVALNEGRPTDARDYFERSLALARASGDKNAQANCLSNLGIVAEREDGLRYFAQALALFEEMGNRSGQGKTLSNLGLMSILIGDYQQAIEYIERALQLLRQVNDPYAEAKALQQLALCHSVLGEIAEAWVFATESHRILTKIQDQMGQAESLASMASLAVELGYREAAEQYALQAIEQAQGYTISLGFCYMVLADVHFARGNYIAGQEATATALKFSNDAQDVMNSLFVQEVGLRIALQVHNKDALLEHVDSIMSNLNHVDELVKPAMVYWTCYRALKFLDDNRQQQILERGYQSVQSRAEKIKDPQRRRSFEAIPYNRGFLQSFSPPVPHEHKGLKVQKATTDR